jgi:hypothetical protein
MTFEGMGEAHAFKGHIVISKLHLGILFVCVRYKWQGKPKSAAFAKNTFNTNTPAHRLDQRFDNGKTQPSAATAAIA